MSAGAAPSAASSVDLLPPTALREHPDQRRIYGDPGGEHDPSYSMLCASIESHGVRVPLVVSRGTPGLPDDTVVSGHRRLAAACEAHLPVVPVIFVAYESATHARLALLEFNLQREKDEWTKTREARALWDVEVELAAQRKAAGLKKGASPPRSGTGTGTGKTKGDGDTREVVAAKLGESGKTTELRVALADKAAEQNPEHPEESPVAQALKSGKAVKTVAREQGVLPAAKPRPAREPEPTVSIFDAPPPAPVAAGPAREPVTCADIEAAVAFLCAHLITHPDAVADALDRVMQRLPSAQHMRVLAAATAREAA